MTRPLILITNDDGFEAKGLRCLVEVAKEFGEVVVVVPNGPRSATGHAITMSVPLRLKHYRTDDDGTQYYRTNGMPCDCVKLGMKVVLKNRPIDLVLSGINHGSNTSISLLYSGTMGAALEASVENIRAIGFSLSDYDLDADFSAAQVYIRKLIAQVLEHGLPPFAALNVNIPAVPLKQIRGIKVTRQALGYWHEEMVERQDPYGGTYYWLTGWLVNNDMGEDTCEWALAHNYVSVQPVQHDMTAHKMIPILKYLEE
ncbi:MAG: 5'/3'-nucleotidase SurE [Bacteroidales bacterium]|nr:5'/3'-nucleotidase SurE [Bacteroidales bacterium]